MKKIIVALALFIYASSATLVASDISDAERNLKSAQKKLSSVTSKRDKALAMDTKVFPILLNSL